MEKLAVFVSRGESRDDYLKAVQQSVAPEITQDNTPEYFLGKAYIQRYNYLYNTLKEVCRDWEPIDGGLSNGAQTPKIVIGKFDEGKNINRITLSFTVDSIEKMPKFITANWQLEQRPHRRHVRNPDRIPTSIEPIQCITVGKADLKFEETPIEEAKQAQEMDVCNSLDYLAYSLEAYQRRIFEATDKAANRRQRVQDDISRAVIDLFGLEY